MQSLASTTLARFFSTFNNCIPQRVVKWLNSLRDARARSPRRVSISVFWLANFLVGSQIFFGCTPPKSAHETPEAAVQALRESVREDRRMDFLGSLSMEMLRAYEHAILIGWPEVRDQFGFLADGAELESVVVVQPITAMEAGPNGADPAWVWPTAECEAVRVRLRVVWKGESFTEDLLFVREVLPEEAGTEGSRFIRVGEQWFLRNRHPNSARYRSPSVGPAMGWKLLAPYLPYQGSSRLAQILREQQSQSEPSEGK